MSNYSTFPTMVALLTFLASPIGAPATDSKTATVDFRYSPPEWQTAICLPDDPCKSLVDRSGELLYHYGQGGREFGTRISVEVVSNAAWQKQELYSARVPIVRTTRTGEGLEIVQEAFAVTGLEKNRSVLTNAAGLERNDLILVEVKNTGALPRVLAPRLVVDTALGFSFEPETQHVQVHQHETITGSLRMTRVADEQGSRRAVQLSSLTLPAGETVRFFIQYSGGTRIATQLVTLKEALAARKRCVAYWKKAPLPYGRLQVPDPGIQALFDSCIRNIWQAREIKKGLPAFQVGPTCYRGLWIVDGAFLLESAAMLGAGQQARSGVAYELTYQQLDGSIHVMDNYSKENGIVLWTRSPRPIDTR